MSAAIGSYSRFSYLLRPSKQVERKLMIEGLTRLSKAGYQLDEYVYLGMGSPYFVDFVLFHKYLYINEMICIEHQAIPRRMLFNKPFDFVKLVMGEVSDVIPTLDRDRRHLVWLDYDYVLGEPILEDLTGLLTVLPSGSVVVVTVKAEVQLPNPNEGGKDAQQRRTRVAADLTRAIGPVYGGPISKGQLTRKRLPIVFARALRNFMNDALVPRKLEFRQLFNYRYADGAQMLTLGGLIDEPGRLSAINLDILGAGCFQSGEDPEEISVPPLTVREKLWLDQNVTPALSSDELAFELDEELFQHFKRYYRYYPMYHEALL